MKYLRVDSWNNAFAISDSKNKGILKICRALTAWTWVSKEHKAGNTSDARSSTQACTLLCLPDSLFLLVDHGKIQSLVKYFHRIPPLKDNFLKNISIKDCKGVADNPDRQHTGFWCIYVQFNRKVLLVSCDFYHKVEQHSVKNTCTRGFLINPDCL